MCQFDAEIRSLEDRLGMTPKARLQLGVEFGKAVKTLDDLNKTLNADEEEDPRKQEKTTRKKAAGQ